ncbi:MAG: hypothetical protein HUJ60_05000, partial [Bacilli bacterium]|nr:hypothetical protein [Bacilli bacterium]
DGLIVAALGEGLIQLTSSYGITPTTPLWIIPPVVRALILGAFVLPLKKKGEHLEKHLVLYSIAIALSTLVVTGLNAAVEWLDGIIMGYSTAYLAAVIGWRFLSSALAGAVMGSVAVPLLKAIRAVRPDEDKRYQESTENVEALKENLEADADKD